MPDIFVAQKIEPIAEMAEPAVTAPEPHGHSLSSFMSYPENVHFDTQEEEEQIILLLRKHWVTNIPWLIFSALLLGGPTFIFPIFFKTNALSFMPGNFIVILSLGWYLLSFGFALVNFIGWYFNVYIVTNERIIDVDFYHLLYKQMASARLSRVQDITYKLGGVMRAIFDYGDVYIQTAGTEVNFDFEAVPHPEQVVRIIGELTEKEQPV